MATVEDTNWQTKSTEKKQMKAQNNLCKTDKIHDKRQSLEREKRQTEGEKTYIDRERARERRDEMRKRKEMGEQIVRKEKRRYL